MHVAHLQADTQAEAEYQRNEEALHRGGAMLNSYRTLKGRELLVLTDLGNSLTTLLLPEEEQSGDG